jgi:Holliday junction resolvasome RuvABC DNA-binding subunit
MYPEDLKSMINTLTGEVIHKDSSEEYLTLGVGGIGYLVFVTNRVSDIARKLYIHEHIVMASQGPSKHDLYGFETPEEREMFRALIKYCDKMGPSTAMKVMNIAPPSQLLQAIRMGNAKYFERGCGEKTANNVILGMGKYAVTAAATHAKSLV